LEETVEDFAFPPTHPRRPWSAYISGPSPEVAVAESVMTQEVYDEFPLVEVKLVSSQLKNLKEPMGGEKDKQNIVPRISTNTVEGVSIRIPSAAVQKSAALQSLREKYSHFLVSLLLSLSFFDRFLFIRLRLQRRSWMLRLLIAMIQIQN
jgi:hypothetical protein